MLPASWPTRFWHRLEDGRVQCDLCPRFCRLHEGQRGFCFVRACEGGAVVLKSYGRSSGFCVDPIEKKPLHHFFPGSAVLSFGTAGCNLGCRFCQNWDISKSRETDTLAQEGSPGEIARAARSLGCRSVAFTYNDPVVFHEYAIDVAKECRKIGVKTVAVTAGEVCPEPRAEFYEWMDAANVDLKSFREEFYRGICAGHLAPVLETLRYLRKETRVWLEITNLVIPGHNDSEAETRDLCRFVASELGREVPLHFTAFHPDWKMVDAPPTPLATLRRARAIAMEEGLLHVYIGNLRDREGQTTFCPSCRAPVIVREGYDIVGWRLAPGGRCASCGAAVAGRFSDAPGNWGSKRMPVTLEEASR